MTVWTGVAPRAARLGCALAALALGWLAAAESGRAQSAGPVLSRDGDRLLVDGTPRFLLFVSYFDAMRRADADGANRGDLEADFAYLRNHGYDGIRVMPNWWRYACPNRAVADGLFTDGSALRASRIGVFRRVLDTAAEHGLLVDVAFTRETLGRDKAEQYNLTVAEYRDQIVAVAGLLKGAHRHVIFDLQNEYGGRLGDEDVRDIAAAVRAVDPGRLLTISTGGGAHRQAGAIAASADLDIASVHPARDPDDWWTDEIDDAIAEAREGMGRPHRPISLQEPMPFSLFPPPHQCSTAVDDDPQRHVDAAVRAMKRGAAAWTFHTRTTFDLATETYVQKLSIRPGERKGLEALPRALGR